MRPIKPLLSLTFPLTICGCLATDVAEDLGPEDAYDTDDSFVEDDGGWEDDDGPEYEPRLAPFNRELWPNGVVRYAFDDGGTAGRPAITNPDRARVQARMADWEDAMTTDYGSHEVQYIDFQSCVPNVTCPSDYLAIRYNQPGESGMGCTVGRLPDTNDGYIRMRLAAGTTDDSTLLHELGHCLGVAHEHERQDRARWLTNENHGLGTAGQATLPLLGNYDYDSVMHYASYSQGQGTSGALRFTDRLGNRFSRWMSSSISDGDVSRVMQYYAQDYQGAWGFFTSLSTLPGNSHSLPNPYLANGVHAVGTPAIAQVNGQPLIVVRGSNDHMYWKTGTSPGGWSSMGCCAGTDPAIVTRASGRAMLTFVGAQSGRVIYTEYNNGSWGGWWYTPDSGKPSGGVGSYYGKRLGPGIASRRTWWFDIFAVQADGRLAVISYIGGGQWTDWQTLGSGYDVDVRPAAVALDQNTVQLATVDNDRLYEPTLTFNGGSVSSFGVGPITARVSNATAPAVTKRNSGSNPYRVLMVNKEGRLSHRFSGQSYWRDIGGMPQGQAGVSSVATGSYSADIVINGEDALGCDTTCITGDAPDPAAVIQPGGIWLRRFE